MVSLAQPSFIFTNFQCLILPHKSGVVVKPLFYYSTIPARNEREIYNHS